MRESESLVRPAVVRVIRSRSQAGTLASPEEIRDVLNQEGLLRPENENRSWADNLQELVGEESDIKKIEDRAGKSYYYSAQHLEDAYALILVQRNDDVLGLMAETVRENSRIYPRPVPLHLFADPPFSMSPAEIDACRKKISELPEYADIADTTTSAGTTFLYSTRHMQPYHAEYLAEWLDVGQSENP